MRGLNRRHFLGAALGGLGLSTLGASPRARANEGGIRRLIFVTTGHGTVYPNWHMDIAKEGEDAALVGLSPGQMSPILTPFYELREKLLVLDGLSAASAICDEPGNNHGIGAFHSLTGGNVFAEGQNPSELPWEGMSVDVRIAERVMQAGRYRSLHLCDLNYDNQNGGYSRERGGAKIPYEGNPGKIFDRLFGDLNMDTVVTPEMRLRQKRSRILDFVSSGFEPALKSTVADDKLKLTQHSGFVAALKQRLEGLSQISCGTPEKPTYDSGSKLERNQALQQVIAATLACDLARVVTYDIRPFNAAQLGAPDKDLHQDFAHKTDPEAISMMTKYGVENAKIVANLAKTLDAVPDGEGTLLDSTLIVWTGELANGGHQFAPFPYVLLGGGAGMVNSGRYVRYGKSHALPSGKQYQGSSFVGPAHNRLLVALCHAMGQTDIEWVGEQMLGSTAVTGPLPGVLA